MKTLQRDAGLLTLAGLTLLTVAACGDDAATDPDADVTALVAIAPQGGATGVDTHTQVVAEFSHPMMHGMEAYADLHEGDLTGPVAPGIWAMSDDHMGMTFTPDEPL
ncbi:MAG TPA: Ig-like domain-containing protein, partial [Longimicrobiales bacterium]|nr:Ig-like domain-containing protein [Longimicrobiales bacterium]